MRLLTSAPHQPTLHQIDCELSHTEVKAKITDKGMSYNVYDHCDDVVWSG